jgi:hypothetical protein
MMGDSFDSQGSSQTGNVIGLCVTTRCRDVEISRIRGSYYFFVVKPDSGPARPQKMNLCLIQA